MKILTSVFLEVENKEKLLKYSKEKNVSMGSIINNAINDYFKKILAPLEDGISEKEKEEKELNENEIEKFKRLGYEWENKYGFTKYSCKIQQAEEKFLSLRDSARKGYILNNEEKDFVYELMPYIYEGETLKDMMDEEGWKKQN